MNIDVEFAPVILLRKRNQRGRGQCKLYESVAVAKWQHNLCRSLDSSLLTYYIYAYFLHQPLRRHDGPRLCKPDRDGDELRLAGCKDHASENIERDVYVNVEFWRCRYTVNFANTENGASQRVREHYIS